MRKRNIIEEPFFNRKMKFLILILVLAVFVLMVLFFRTKKQEEMMQSNSANIESVVSSEKNNSEFFYSSKVQSLTQNNAEQITTEAIKISFKAIQNLQLLPRDNVNSDTVENKKFISLYQVFVDPVTALNTFNRTVNFTTQAGNLMHGQNGDNQQVKTPVNTDTYALKDIEFSKLNQINDSLYVIGTTINYQIGKFPSETKIHFLINSQNGKISKIYQSESDSKDE